MDDRNFNLVDFSSFLDYRQEDIKARQNELIKEKQGPFFRRVNHFREWLGLINGVEKMENEINELIPNIKNEINNRYITNLNLLKITKLLKELKLYKYLEHSKQIYKKVVGGEIKKISPEIEEKLMEMFNAIQEPFEKHHPPSRTSFLPYSFILIKFFELLDMSEYASDIDMIKSVCKLRVYEEMWKKVCDELGWKYHTLIF
jgi:hypothetical protein